MKENLFCKWCGKDYRKESSPYRHYCCEKCKTHSTRSKKYNGVGVTTSSRAIRSYRFSRN
ncbi:MAG: hypothetical protein FWC41_06535 [Firmicutes bacterium]|nr:hypothetical protein [Bacillota bacterium]